MLQLFLTVLRSKLRAKGFSFTTLRISWPPPKLKSLPLKTNWRRLRRQGNWLRRLGIRPSKMGMTWEWQRLKKPSRLRSRGCVGPTAPKYGMKLSIKLGLRLHLYLGG